MNRTVLYLDCSSGISGDMTVAALLDLGADRQVLIDGLNSLPLSGYSIEIKDVLKSGIRACDFNVILDAKHENHDHDMDYLHGNHSHEHTHEHHDARNLNDIIALISAGIFTEKAKELAVRIFTVLAEAEAQVHGKSIEEVHFHEVGAVDSIIDIVAAAICIDNLNPDEIIVSALTDGVGQIRCQHGIIPIPVPAVTAIAQNQRLTLKISDIPGELVTPTGAAIAAVVRTGTTLPDGFQLLRTGLGAGKRDYPTTGVLRAMLLQPVNDTTHDIILSLETNIDDCSGEAIAFTMQQLMEQGALDAFCIPIYMKKNRPAQLLKVICEKEKRTQMESIIFQNTTTIGIRVQEMNRTKLSRRIITLETPWGMADVKCCSHGNETYYYPENDSICKLAAENQIGFPDMYGMVKAYAGKI